MGEWPRETIRFTTRAAVLIIPVVIGGWWFGGSTHGCQALVTALACYVPAVVVVALAEKLGERGVVWQMAIVLGGMMVRMAIALTCGLIVTLVVPGWRTYSVWIWLLGCYMGVLSLEVTSLLFLLGRGSKSEQMVVPTSIGTSARGDHGG